MVYNIFEFIITAGVIAMSDFKEINLLLAHNIYSDALNLANKQNISIEELIINSLNTYLSNNSNKVNINIDDLINGYKYNGRFNSDYAEMCLDADNQCLASCEEKLSECE